MRQSKVEGELERREYEKSDGTYLEIAMDSKDGSEINFTKNV